jgi:hypothetical protein
MDARTPQELALLRQIAAANEYLRWPLGPKSWLLTDRALPMKDSEGSPCEIGLHDIIDVRVEEHQVYIRQFAGSIIDFSTVRWDGWRHPIVCADDAEAADLAQAIQDRMARRLRRRG